MVWARTKLLIWEYIFEPVKDLRISYSGPKPETIYPKIKELIRTVFNIPDAYIQEKNYSWDRSKESEKFEVEWEITKVLDVYSYIVVEISLRGFSAGGEGKADIRIKPRMITEYPQDTILQQSIVYEMLRRFWHTHFYHRKRMEYLNMGKELLVNFETAIKKYMDDLREQARVPATA